MKTTRALAAALALLLALTLLPLEALAAELMDLNQSCQLSVSYRDKDKALSGASFSLHRVADLDAKGTPSATADFAAFEKQLRSSDDKVQKALAADLAEHVSAKSLRPFLEGKTDSQGHLLFTSVQPGLYLLLGAPHEQDGLLYEAQPALVLLPGRAVDGSGWNYSLSVKPKFDAQPTKGSLSRRVIKVWDDRGHRDERPNNVLIRLLRDGKVYETVSLNSRNNWRYSWSGLEKGHRWTVAERVPDQYDVEIERQGDCFIVTNTWDEPDGPHDPDDPEEPEEPEKPKTPPPEEPRLPQTGQLWWPVPLLLSGGLLCMVLGLLRRRGDQNGTR